MSKMTFRIIKTHWIGNYRYTDSFKDEVQEDGTILFDSYDFTQIEAYNWAMNKQLPARVIHRLKPLKKIARVKQRVFKNQLFRTW